jgi:hypothetical protein
VINTLEFGPGDAMNTINFTKTAARGVTSELKAAEEVERETATQVESNSGLRKKL